MPASSRAGGDICAERPKDLSYSPCKHWQGKGNNSQQLNHARVAHECSPVQRRGAAGSSAGLNFGTCSSKHVDLCIGVPGYVKRIECIITAEAAGCRTGSAYHSAAQGVRHPCAPLGQRKAAECSRYHLLDTRINTNNKSHRHVSLSRHVVHDLTATDTSASVRVHASRLSVDQPPQLLDVAGLSGCAGTLGECKLVKALLRRR
jgi:hypothetical protein